MGPNIQTWVLHRLQVCCSYCNLITYPNVTALPSSYHNNSELIDISFLSLQHPVVGSNIYSSTLLKHTEVVEYFRLRFHITKTMAILRNTTYACKSNLSGDHLPKKLFAIEAPRSPSPFILLKLFYLNNQLRPKKVEKSKRKTMDIKLRRTFSSLLCHLSSQDSRFIW